MEFKEEELFNKETEQEMLNYLLNFKDEIEESLLYTREYKKDSLQFLYTYVDREQAINDFLRNISDEEKYYINHEEIERLKNEKEIIISWKIIYNGKQYGAFANSLEGYLHLSIYIFLKQIAETIFTLKNNDKKMLSTEANSIYFNKGE